MVIELNDLLAWLVPVGAVAGQFFFFKVKLAVLETRMSYYEQHAPDIAELKTQVSVLIEKIEALTAQFRELKHVQE